MLEHLTGGHGADTETESLASEQRVRFLAEVSDVLASSLDYETTLRRVAQFAVPRLADWCAIDMVVERGAVSRLVVAHVDPEKVKWAHELERRFPYDPNVPSALRQVLQEGESIFLPEITDEMLAAGIKDKEQLEISRAIGFSSVIMVPLIARERTLGALSLVAAESDRHFTEDDLELARELARRAALAVDNARLYAAEQEARREAEEIRQRQAFLLDMSATFSASLDYEQTLATVAELAVPRFADLCVVHILNSDASLQQLAVAHQDPERQQRVRQAYLHHFPTYAGTHPIGRALESGDAVLDAEMTEADWADIASDSEHLALIELLAPCSAIVAPLIAHGRPLGIVSFIYSESGRHYTEDERLLAREIAQRAAVAVDNARLYREAEQQTARATARADASRAIAEARFDADAIYRSILRVANEQIGDMVTIRLVSEDGMWLEAVASLHSDPARQESLAEFLAGTPVHISEGLTGRVFTSGQPVRIPGTAPALPSAVEPKFLGNYQRVGGENVLIVPLRVGGGRTGVMALLRGNERGPYSAEDQSFAQDLADIAALAIENARLYQQTQEHATRVAAQAEIAQAVAWARLDEQAIAESISATLAALTGDATVVRFVSDDRQWLNLVALDHPNPEARQFLAKLLGATPLRVGEGLNGHVFETGRALHLPAQREGEARRWTKPEYWAYQERFSPQGSSLLIVPIWIGEHIVGTIALFRDGQRPGYTEDEQGLVQDVANRAALAIENARLYRDAQSAVREREAFLSTASHELKTPLTTVKGYGQLLQRFLRQPELDREHLIALATHLQDQTSRFETLVNDLLDVSRIQQGKLALRRQPTDLSQLAVDVLTRFEQSPERTPDHWLVLDAMEVQGLWDPIRLDQVLTNLVSNALKYSPAGGEVRVTLREEDGQAVLAVRDQGIGIPLDEQRRLFEPFMRGAQARRQIGGTGLGLYITWQIIEQHGGTVSYESTPGAGTTFTVRLPINPPEDAGDKES